MEFENTEFRFLSINQSLDIKIGQHISFLSDAKITIDPSNGIYKLKFVPPTIHAGLDIWNTDGYVEFGLLPASGEAELNTRDKKIKINAEISIMPTMLKLPKGFGFNINAGLEISYGAGFVFDGTASIDLTKNIIKNIDAGLQCAQASIKYDHSNRKFYFSSMVGLRIVSGSVGGIFDIDVQASNSLELDLSQGIYRSRGGWKFEQMKLGISFEAAFEADLVHGTQRCYTKMDFGILNSSGQGLSFFCAENWHNIDNNGIRFNDASLNILNLVNLSVDMVIDGESIKGSFVIDGNDSNNINSSSINGVDLTLPSGITYTILSGKFDVDETEFKGYLEMEIMDTITCAEMEIRDGWSLPKIDLCDTGSSIEIISSCPVDLMVKAPDGAISSKDTMEIPSIYNEVDLDNDMDLDDEIIIIDPVGGYYQIEVIPEPDALSDDTYSLEIHHNGVITKLAEEAQIQEIPEEPYEFLSQGFNATISMNVGWHLISLPVHPQNTDIESVLDSIWNDYESIMTYKPDSGWYGYSPLALEFSSLTDIESGIGYWINIANPTTLAIPQWEQPKNYISLKEGWNLVGFPSRFSKNIEECMASIKGKYNSVWEFDPIEGWRYYFPDAPDIGILWFMRPWYGYWIEAKEDCVWEIGP